MQKIRKNSATAGRRGILSLCLMILSLSFSTMEAAVKIDKIEPADWFEGMMNPS